MLVLSYLGLLSIIPLVVKKDDPEVQWHAKNGLALACTWIIFWVLEFIIGYFMPTVVSCGVSLIGCVLAVGYLIVIVIGIMKALKGERLRVPVVTDFAEKM